MAFGVNAIVSFGTNKARRLCKSRARVHRNPVPDKNLQEFVTVRPLAVHRLNFNAADTTALYNGDIQHTANNRKSHSAKPAR